MLLNRLSGQESLVNLVEPLAEAGVAKVAAALVSSIICYRIVYALFFSPLRHVPGPFFARITSMRANIINLCGGMKHAAHADGEAYGDIYVLEPNSISISHPDDVRTVLRSHTFVKSKFYQSLETVGTPHTFSSSDPGFVSMRQRQMGPYFQPSYLSLMEPKILRYSCLALKEKWGRLLDKSADGRIEINYSRDFSLMAFDVIGVLAFGQEFNSLKNGDETAAKWVDSSTKYHAMLAMFPVTKYFPFSLAIRPWESRYRELSEFGKQSVAKRRKHLENGGEKPHDLLQAYVDALDPESKVRMSDNEVRSEVNLTLLAGADTTSTTLAWTVSLLMLYPKIYAQAVDEVRSKFDTNHVITFSEAQRSLPFVEACLFESMRLCPVVGGQVPRVSPPEGATLRGHFIPPGTEIYVSFAGVSVSKHIWTDPLKYDPTRFLNSPEARRNLFSFSYGVRICPGRHLAKLQMLAVLANMLKDYDWSLPDDYTHLGPHVLNEHGYPKLMKSIHLLTSAPEHPDRDCRLILTRRR
ncbi:putative cytochrome P450 monooxygenase [Linderina pennispora]|uniref:Putative cytochrome P450 monooxygenase n=1 Tax=Linderina pennispora TaxID=61395 RepID=A0A1Y1VZZ9_9FUNG|nr:putative cytochrome P450 monooxygenase [Linderina pennispora]ORX66586.1 putative cytochrome P450 monooxygenase [Linderina pennispora]